MSRNVSHLAALAFAALLVAICSMPATATHLTGVPATYTIDLDFDDGALINVNHDSPNNNQLQLNARGEPFNFIWVAASARGTIIKIDTLTGQILGEYLSAPAGRLRNPSRTTVDANGNVWAGSRDEAVGGRGSVVHVGLEENGQCVDRNSNSVIDTSTGLGDIKAWSNPGGVDDNGGVSSADDECIIHYVRTAGTNVRTVAVDGSNNVWIGGLGNRIHELHNSAGAVVPGTQSNVFCGGYGGLVDGNGVLWSARGLMRYDPASPPGVCLSVSNSYGLALDSTGHVWNSQWTNNTITRLSPAGGILNTYSTGGSCSRGVAVTADDHIWVANSCSNTVTRLNNSGVLQATIAVGNHPTGLSVDAAGLVWVTNLNSSDVMRIDPSTNLVNLTMSLGAGAGPYNYSDMTGATVTAPPDNGTWTLIHDSAIVGLEWGKITWTASEPSDSSIGVTAASSSDGISFGPPQAVTQGADLTVADGQYLRVMVSFTRATTDGDNDGVNDSPILFDLTIDRGNEPPDCSAAAPSVDPLWPPNHKMVDVYVLDVTDPDGDPVTITIDSIFQDEPVDTFGDGRFTPDGAGVGTGGAQVRAERAGTRKVMGNGRVYHVGFTAEDGKGGVCSGEVLVGVPHDQGGQSVPVDDGALFDSTATSP